MRSAKQSVGIKVGAFDPDIIENKIIKITGGN